MENILLCILLAIVPIFTIWKLLDSNRIYIKSSSLRVHIILYWDGWCLLRDWKPYCRRGRLTFRIPGFNFDKKISYPRSKISLIAFSRDCFLPKINYGFDDSRDVGLTAGTDIFQI